MERGKEDPRKYDDSVIKNGISEKLGNVSLIPKTKSPSAAFKRNIMSKM